MFGYKPAPNDTQAAAAPADPQKVYFKAPEGLDISGRVEGTSFEVVAELTVEKDGKLCLSKLNGISLGKPTTPKPAADPAEPDQDDGGFETAVNRKAQ